MKICTITFMEMAVAIGAPMKPRRSDGGPQTRRKLRKMFKGAVIQTASVGATMRP